MAVLGLSAPWVLYYRQINAMFGADPEVHVIFDEEELELKLYVENATKAAAIEELLPTEKNWGETTLYIMVYPPNDAEPGMALKGLHPKELFKYAFEENPIFSHCIYIDTIFSNGLLYVVFKKIILQYYSDSLNDPHGITSTLAQEIAKEIFITPNGVYYSTDIS